MFLRRLPAAAEASTRAMTHMPFNSQTCPVWSFGVAQTQYTQVYGVPADNTYYISPMLHTVEASGLKPETK